MIYNPGLDTLAVSSARRASSSSTERSSANIYSGTSTTSESQANIRSIHSATRAKRRSIARLSPAFDGSGSRRSRSSGNRLTVRYSHEDLFAALGEQIGAILARGFIAKASFAVKFVGAKTARSVSVWQPSRASYTRDEDRLLVEAWMQEQGFLAEPAEAVDAETETVLADVEEPYGVCGVHAHWRRFLGEEHPRHVCRFLSARCRSSQEDIRAREWAALAAPDAW